MNNFNNLLGGAEDGAENVMKMTYMMPIIVSFVFLFFINPLIFQQLTKNIFIYKDDHKKINYSSHLLYMITITFINFVVCVAALPYIQKILNNHK